MKTQVVVAVLLVALVSVCAARVAEGNECSGDSNTSRWRKDCNWCTCRNGRQTCTRKLCPQGEQSDEPQCEGSVKWKEDCNTCYCLDGNAICTSNVCGQIAPEESVTVEATRVSGECVEGSRWREECNWCTCVEGHGHCTTSSCVDWSEQKAQQEGTVECHGTSRWKKDCNWCKCTNGHGVCTQRACIPRERDPFHGLPEGAMCVPGSSWKLDCNWCSCTENGGAACTLMGCLPGFEQAPGEPTCEEGSIWRNDDCNLCRCIDGVSACTKRLCRTPPETSPRPLPGLQKSLVAPQEEPQCKGNPETDRWRENCNWCTCRNGVGACTKRLCREGAREDDSVCEGHPSWKRDCNSCVCVNGTAVCTSADCELLEGPKVPVEGVRIQIGRDSLQCVDGSRWRVDCNWCTCNEGHAACTEIGCLPGFKSDEPECEGEARWKKDCNWCNCHEGKALCTKMACANRGKARSLCIEGHTWRQDCNTCRCSNGLPLCTRRACLKRGRQLCRGADCGDGTLPDLCSLPHTSGLLQCTGYFPKWSYSSLEGQCQQIIYGGCAGTENLFETQEDCEAICPSSPSSGVELHRAKSLTDNRCLLPQDSGPCFASFTKFFYNAETGQCTKFLYGGCEGNRNRFDSIQECEAACAITQG